MRYVTPLVSLFVLVATGPGRAQQLQLGLKAGLLASTAITRSVSTARVGGVAGGWLRYPGTKRVGLQVELGYEQRGVKTTQHEQLGWEGAIGSYTRQARTRLHYLSLPLLMRAQVGHFVGLIGPHVSYLLAARQRAQTQYVLQPTQAHPAFPYPATETSRDPDAFRRWELGYTAGLGYMLGACLALEVRYAAGVTAFYKPPTGVLARYEPLSPLAQARQRTWQAQLSYQLRALPPAR
ncbi:porin family protein [Hymenobacter crusticola]|uniref:Outer membrane protein beta-barrel domain-containing protein n=1 Tax=Hymenobacter crusticola TaxID=1770526 RepID=A0A243W5V3_9BACT|nr:porin family protein [Hymenobacter crusticola]OUJ69065.1 hypothetical protein BXP70_27010 [Hymenobacter crusticola]